jgi:hypothetical protein
MTSPSVAYRLLRRADDYSAFARPRNGGVADSLDEAKAAFQAAGGVRLICSA